MSGASLWYANLSPETRVAAARAQPFSRFAAEQEARALLLVSLRNQTAEFLAILSRVDGEPRDTVVSDMLDPLTRIGEPARQTWPSELARSFDEDALAGLVEKTHHFVMAVRKRPGAETQEPGHITVGRSRDNDIVLSSATVSKFHAWLEIDEKGTHWLTDRGSRNGTRINGQRIAADRAAALEPGDRLEFGLVRAVLCPITTFWRALHQSSH